MDTNAISLIQTCIACPEQYDAFSGDKQVGYLRLRHGYFRVDYPDCGGETIYDAQPKGDGMFETEERTHYLEEAKKAILRKINGGSVNSCNYCYPGVCPIFAGEPKPNECPGH